VFGRAEEHIRVVVVSPSDVVRERAVAQMVVEELNRGIAGDRGCRLSLWRWEIDARPGLHLEGAQGLIDELMKIQDADVVVGVFWKRFGTATGAADSGTEHELRRAWTAWQEQGRPEVMVYFCTRAYSPKTPDELAQWQRVLEFQQALPEQQLWWPYTTIGKFERLLREHLTALLLSRAAVAELGQAPTSTRDSRRAFPVPSVLAASTRDMLVGRTNELEALAGVYAEAAGGARRLVLLCGEPGIGKTRLAAGFALRAHDEGAVVLYGRCDEEALLALQPFVEALRHYVGACPPRELARRLQLVSGELRRIVPELAERIPGLPQPIAGDPDGARSRLFEAVSSLLCEAAQSTPVVLVLEDLHWADKATLLLLKYLARYPREARLMVLGTYRETEVDVDDPLSAMLAELGRERLLERRALGPLDAAAVSELIGVHAGDRASPELSRIVYERTGGNAFFVVEVLRQLMESGAIGSADAEPESGIDARSLMVPEGVKGVIAQRLADLGRETNELLERASVLGREFELDVLQRMSEVDEDELVDGLDSAVHARVIEEVAGAAGRYTFSHALIRDSVYGGLTATRRALFHRRAGAALEQAHGSLEPYLAELAYHFAQAGFSGDLDKAIEYGTRAGEHAISQLAYERAAAHFRQTAELIDTAGAERQQRQRCDLVIAQGEAERQAGDRAYRQTLLHGACLAQQLEDPDRLARAALANNRGFFSFSLGVDRDRVSVLRAALDAYDSADSATRAALLSVLALELTWTDDWSLREKLSADAVAMARRVGDPQTLVLVLTQRGMTQLTPQTLPELQGNLREAGELADRLKDPLRAAQAACLGAHVAMNAGDLEQADRLLTRLSAVSEQLRQPVMRWYDLGARAKRCTISGPTAEAERLAFAAAELGRIAEQPDSMLWFMGQLYGIRFLEGSLDRGDPYLPDLIDPDGAPLPADPDMTPSRTLALLGRGMASLILCEVGRLDEARGHFEQVMSSGLDELPHDYSALAIPAQASVVCARLGDKGSAEQLYAILEPHSHRLVSGGVSWFGATTHYLGLLAATLDRHDEADARFGATERTYATLDAKPWLGRLYSDWAGTLLTGGRGEGDRRAEQLLKRAASCRGLA
jgi:hypothetical protein